MTDVNSYGYLYVNGSDSYGGAVIGWGESSDNWTFHRVYEYVTGGDITHKAFCYYRDNNAWGYNDKSTTCVSEHDWGEVKPEYRNKSLYQAATIFNEELPSS